MRAKRSLGQNFLRDYSIIDRIIDALDLDADDTVIEIGPGQGALTSGLLDAAGHVIAIEFDRDLIAPLRVQFHGASNLTIFNEDALSVDLAEILKGSASAKTKLIANLPYNISTPILQRLVEQRHLFARLVLMFQREVVERITAKPGGRERGYLSVLVENAFETERLFDVPPTAFRPVPKVWSAVVRFTPKTSSLSDETGFRDLLSRTFAQKRKTLLNNLKSSITDIGSKLTKAGIDGKRRAETLTLEEWITLFSTLSAEKPGG
jgi:16S rRNA (adenine1518-N6/adenine1519-N6)-dimethyltransferase